MCLWGANCQSYLFVQHHSLEVTLFRVPFMPCSESVFVVAGAQLIHQASHDDSTSAERLVALRLVLVLLLYFGFYSQWTGETLVECFDDVSFVQCSLRTSIILMSCLIEKFPSPLQPELQLGLMNGVIQHENL